MPTHLVTTERSTVLVSARSSMGPIVFEARGVSGTIDATVERNSILTDPAPSARLEIDLRSLRSGSDLYDAELRRRVDVRRHPLCVLDLERVEPLGVNRFTLRGTIQLHGTLRTLQGTVEVSAPDQDRLVVTGEKTIDVRDFDLPSPSVLMLKIYPEVKVQLFIEAAVETAAMTFPEVTEGES